MRAWFRIPLLTTHILITKKQLFCNKRNTNFVVKLVSNLIITIYMLIITIFITFEDCKYEFQELGPLGPHMIHRWIRLDPRNSKTWKQKPFSGSNRFYDRFSGSERFALLWLTQGSYRNGRDIHGSGLK